MKSRFALIDAAVIHREPRAIDRAVNAMFVTFPSSRVSGEEAEAMIAAYSWALSDVSSLAVEEAVKRFVRGQISGANGAFAPSAADLHAEAERIVAAWRRELIVLRRLLDAKVREPIASTSKERQTQIERQLEAANARVELEAKLSGLGLDSSELDKIPDAPPRPNSFCKATID